MRTHIVSGGTARATHAFIHLLPPPPPRPSKVAPRISHWCTTHTRARGISILYTIFTNDMCTWCTVRECVCCCCGHHITRVCCDVLCLRTDWGMLAAYCLIAALCVFRTNTIIYKYVWYALVGNKNIMTNNSKYIRHTYTISQTQQKPLSFSVAIYILYNNLSTLCERCLTICLLYSLQYKYRYYRAFTYCQIRSLSFFLSIYILLYILMTAVAMTTMSKRPIAYIIV